MTSAPADLVAFRSQLLQITGLSGNALGIAPDPAHLSSGGYHVGCEDIQRIGRWLTDYSTRQARDRRDGTNTASAVDIGSTWKSGRAAWLRFNNALYQEMRDRPGNLPALRAINVSLDGKAKRRYDQNSRSAGLVSSTDTVDTHTHLEFWRDTEGRRAATLDRIVQLAQAAVSGATPAVTTGDDDMSWDETIGDDYAPSSDYGQHKFRTFAGYTWAGVDRANGTLAQLVASAQADEVRDKATLAAIQAIGVATGADLSPVITAVNAVRDEARTRFSELAAENADLRAQLDRAVAAAEVGLSPTERAAIDGKA